MATSNPSTTKVVDTTHTLHSPATKFEVALIEDAAASKQKKGPTESRMVTVFSVFDEVVSQLGVYSKVMKMVRDEMFEAIYSQEFTSTSHQTTKYSIATNKAQDKKTEDHTFIQRVPYFTLIQGIYDQRNEEADVLRDQLEKVKKRLQEKHKQLEDAITINSTLKEEMENLRDIISKKNGKINLLEDDILELQDNIEDLRDSADIQKKQMDIENEILQAELKSVQNEVSYLSQYKKGYDDLHESFVERVSGDRRRKKKKPVIATRRAHLLNNWSSAKKLEEQLLTVQNQTIEEFDAFVEEHKVELEGKTLKDNVNDSQFSEEEAELERMDKELQQRQEIFQKTIEALNDELSMIRQHKESLEHQWEELESQYKHEEEIHKSKPPSSRMRPSSKDSLRPNVSSGMGSSRPGSQSALESRSDKAKDIDSVMSLGEDFDNLDPTMSEMDPFVPQETILSKYSAMIYTSTNHAKSFHELKDAKFCGSCGEKTVICPHKVSGDKVVILPHNCTHVKLSRPKVRINVEVREKLYAQMPKPAVSDSSKLSTKRMRGRMSIVQPLKPMQSIADLATTPNCAEEPPAIFKEEKDTTVLGAAHEHQVNSFLQLWDDYKKRTPLTRDVPRPLELGRVLSIISQYYANLLWQDEYALDEEQVTSFLDTFYNYLLDRYILQDVVYLCVHDFITGLIEYSTVNKTVQTFAHMLVGNLDGATFRYLLLIADFIDKVEWKEVSDFRLFATTIYPFLTDDELDQLSLGYTSFSENKISKGLVHEYFMYIVLKYREPRFQDCEAKLLQHPGKEPGAMNNKEYSEALDAIAPLANEKLRNRLFQEAEAMSGENGRVNVMKLSQITAYLLLQQVAPLLRQNLGLKIEQGRIRPTSELSLATSSMTFESRVVEDEFQLMTLTKLKNLAKNIARRATVRSMRRIENDLATSIPVLKEEDEFNFGMEGDEGADDDDDYEEDEMDNA
ncbi:uncharacterized protein [Ptychodera flava]|uniref:uncharacterized protein isoform X2 n=1 Tax=Ptychodera flava TaxID=63121 RepID=UPI00396A8CDE